MMSKIKKPIYKKWWFYAIILILGLIYLGNSFMNSAEFEMEHLIIINQIDSTSYKINNIETKYSKNGLVYYYDFSEPDLKNYLKLLKLQEENYEAYLEFVVDNEKQFKKKGKSNLAISELIKEIRLTIENLQGTQLKVASVQNIEELFNF